MLSIWIATTTKSDVKKSDVIVEVTSYKIMGDSRIKIVYFFKYVMRGGTVGGILRLECDLKNKIFLYVVRSKMCDEKNVEKIGDNWKFNGGWVAGISCESCHNYKQKSMGDQSTFQTEFVPKKKEIMY